MDLVIKSKDVKAYELFKVDVKTGKDGKSRYAVCEFKQAGLDRILQEQASSVVMQLMAAYGSDTKHEDEYFDVLSQSIGRKMNIARVEVSGFPDFLRKDNDGKLLTNKSPEGKLVASVYNSVFIYTLCTDDGVCIKTDDHIIRRGKGMFENSSRIITKAAYEEQRAKAKAAKEAAQAAAQPKPDPLLASVELDDEL